MASTPRKMAFGVLLFLAQPKVTSSECRTCQNDDDCSSHESLVEDIASNNATSDQSHPFTICNEQYLLCVNEDNLLGIDCPCWNGEECESGRCEGIFGTCQPRLDAGAICNEDSDCISGICGNFIFQCLTEEPTLAPEERTKPPYRSSSPLPSPAPVVDVDIKSDNEDMPNLFSTLLISIFSLFGLLVCLVSAKNLEPNDDEYNGRSQKRNENGSHTGIIDLVPPGGGGDFRGDVGGCSSGGGGEGIDFGGCDCDCGGCDCGGCDCVIS